LAAREQVLSILIERIKTSKNGGPSLECLSTSQKKSLVTVENISESRMHPHNACKQKEYLEQRRNVNHLRAIKTCHRKTLTEKNSVRLDLLSHL